VVDENEAALIKKEKVMWKHRQDEELRDKLYLNLKEKLEQPLPAPELYDPVLIKQEREDVERQMLQSNREERMRRKLVKAHETKYANFWSTSHAAKLS